MEKRVYGVFRFREKLVACGVCVWCAPFLACVRRREKRAAVGTFLWSWYFLFSIRTCENRDRVTFQKAFCQSQHFFLLFSIPHFCLLLLQRVCRRKIWWCCWGTKTLADVHTHTNANANTHPFASTQSSPDWALRHQMGYEEKNGSGKRHFSSSSYWNVAPRLRWHIPMHQTMTGWIYKDKKSKAVRFVWWAVIFNHWGCFWLVTHFDLMPETLKSNSRSKAILHNKK